MKKRKPYTKNRKFKNERVCSLEEVANELGISIERVRIIESTALNKCRQWCEQNDFDMETLIAFASRDKSTYKLTKDINLEVKQ